MDKAHEADEEYGLEAVPDGDVDTSQPIGDPLGEPYDSLNDNAPVNVSEVQDWMRCRFRWLCKWVLNRVPRFVPAPLTLGKAGHLIFEDVLLGRATMQQAIDLQIVASKAALLTEVNPDARAALEEVIEMLTDLTEPLLLWKDAYPFEAPCLEVEQAFTFRDPVNPTIIWRGRPDRVGVMQGKLFHVQTKFLNASTKFAIVGALSKRSFHEHLYAAYLSRKYMSVGDGYTLPDGEFFPAGIPYGGTLMNFVRKLKYRTKRTKANPDGEAKRIDEMFWQYPLAIDVHGDVHEHVMASMRQHALEMREAREQWEFSRIVPAANEHMNGGMFGNKVDPYFSVLLGETGLDNDDLFMDREDTYAQEGVAE